MTRLNDVHVGYLYVLLQHDDTSVLYNTVVAIVALLKTCASLCHLRKKQCASVISRKCLEGCKLCHKFVMIKDNGNILICDELSL